MPKFCTLKYLDVPGLLALAAPKPILIFGEDEKTAAVTAAVYKAAGASERLQFADRKQMNSDFILKWIRSVEADSR